MKNVPEIKDKPGSLFDNYFSSRNHGYLRRILPYDRERHSFGEGHEFAFFSSDGGIIISSEDMEGIRKELKFKNVNCFIFLVH